MSSNSNRTHVGRRLGFEALEDRQLLAVDFSLVKDINLQNTTSSNPEYLTAMDGQIYFAAKSREAGIELWRSDGTAVGTSLVKDIHPGTADSSPKALTVFNGALYFIAWDGVHGEELWRSDGTPDGTYLVKDIREGAVSADVTALFVRGGKMYFSADDGVHGREAWVSDGTSEGTRLLLNINPGAGHSQPGNFTEFAGRVFFTANPTGTTEGQRLWTTDGTPEGTQQFVVDPPEYSNAAFFDVVGDRLYYSTDYGLVKTDGTSVGTELVKSFSQRPSRLIGFGNTLYFLGYDSSNGYELWTSNGTEAGTGLLKAFEPGTSSVDLQLWSEFEGSIYFSVVDSSTHYLWTTDGTPGGTVPVQSFGVRSIGTGPMRIGEKVLLIVEGDLWETDFTPDGGKLFKDLTVGNSLTGVRYPLLLNGVLYFTADTGEYGRELWRSDGTLGGTQMVVDLYADTTGSSPFDVQVLNNKLYFLVTIGQFQEFWTSDGTAAGTYRVRDLALGNLTNRVLSLTRLGDRLLMTVKNGASGEQLWQSDGTEAGTTLVKVLRESNNGSIAFGRPAFFAEAGGLAYFRGLRPDGNPSYLWRTDGTEAGTYTVNDLDNGASLLYPRSMTGVGDFMMFRGDDGIHGFELWRSDGTNEGTYLVKDINQGSAGSADTSSSDIPGTPAMTSIGGTLYFFANDGTSGFELWRSDGTADGTYRVKDIRPGAAGSRTSIRGDSMHTFAVGNTLYFLADDGVNGSELWKSDGTELGTVMAGELIAGPGSSSPGLVMDVNGTVFFRANDGVTGPQIWKIEPGSPAPERVTNIAPAPNSNALPSGFANIQGTLYFSADDGVHGRELWRTDGTMAGTVLAYDFTGDTTSGSPSRITLLGGRLMATAASAANGREWWVADFAAAGDFNFDGDVDAADHALWRQTFGSTSELSADANRNGVVDAADYSIWRDRAAAPTAVVTGDYDRDGLVGASDYQLWRANFGCTTQLQADGNGSGVVDAADYTIWRDHFMPTGGAAALVAAEVTEGFTFRANVQEVARRETALEAIFGLDVSKELGRAKPFSKPRSRMPENLESTAGSNEDSLLALMSRWRARNAVFWIRAECETEGATRGPIKDRLFEDLGLWPGERPTKLRAEDMSDF